MPSAKIGRNDPCYCGSGKKYKHCHMPIDEAAQVEQRQLRKAQDTLMPKIIDAARGQPEAFPDAIQRYWNGKYSVDQLIELDDLEDHGAERFLSWFAFDYAAEDGSTLVERLAAGKPSLELDDTETQLLNSWNATRLRPYIADRVLKGQNMTVRDLLDERVYEVEDHAASRRVQPGEVLVVHLVPVGTTYTIGGAAAHLTADTSEKLREYTALYLEALVREQPDATWDDLVRRQSEIFSHFVMALPVEESNPTLLENIVVQTRVALKLAGEAVGIGRSDEAPSADKAAAPDETHTNEPEEHSSNEQHTPS